MNNNSMKLTLGQLILISLSIVLTGCSVSSQKTLKGNQIVHERTGPIIFNDSAPHIEVNDDSLIVKANIFSERQVTRTDRLVTTVIEKDVPVVTHIATGLTSAVFLGLFQIKMLFVPDSTVYECNRNNIKCSSTSTFEDKTVELPLRKITENKNFLGTFEIITDDVSFYTELNKNGTLKIKKERLAGATNFTLKIVNQHDKALFDFSLPELYTGNTTWKKTQENKGFYHSFAWYQKAAKQGNVFAVYKLGLHYEEGVDTKKDIYKAMELYKQASDNGVREAQFKLGQLYFNGSSINQNDSKAVAWYEKAMEKGDPNAQNSLGELYYKGREVDQDKNKALQLYLRSAKQSNKNAQFNLSVFYYDFSGSENLMRSYQWGVIAQKNGFDAKKEIKIIKSEMSKADIKKANKYIKRCLASHYSDCL